jgi:hypothetical protein
LRSEIHYRFSRYRPLAAPGIAAERTDELTN